MPVQKRRVESASGRARSPSGKREGTGSIPARSTLALLREAATSACIAEGRIGKRTREKGPRSRSHGPAKAYCWLLDLVLQGVAGGELGDLGSGDVDPLLGLRVDPLPGFALLHVELAEAGDLDLLALLEVVGDDLGERVEEPLGVALRGICLAGDL